MSSLTLAIMTLWETSDASGQSALPRASGQDPPAGGRSTDPRDYPAGRSEYALRDVATLTAKASAAGPAAGIYAARC